MIGSCMFAQGWAHSDSHYICQWLHSCSSIHSVGKVKSCMVVIADQKDSEADWVLVSTLSTLLSHCGTF